MRWALWALLFTLVSQIARGAPGEGRERDYGANAYAGFLNNNQSSTEVSPVWKDIETKLSLSYYVSLMGPSPGLPPNQTYNVFLEGPAPLQLFHAGNLRWQFNADWAMGVTLAGIQHFTEKVKTEDGAVNDNKSEVFNMRTYVSVPALDLYLAKAFHTFAIEFPTTPGSRDDELRYGLVISQSVNFSLPPSAFSLGWSTQYIRYEYAHHTLPAPFPGGTETPLQTVLLTTGPFATIQLDPHWQIASSISLDWDQRGDQTGGTDFNNNLPDRARLALNYFFLSPPLTHIGLYTQALTKPSKETTIFGLDFSVRF